LVDHRTLLVILGLVLLAAVVAILWSLGQRRRRANRLRRVAEQLGWSFEHDGKSLLNEPPGTLPLFEFARLASGEILNVMRGHAGGYPAVLCDYHYWTGIGSDRSDYDQTVFCFRAASASSPDFSLAPKLSSIEKTAVTLAAKVWKLSIPERDSGGQYGVQKVGEWMAVWKRDTMAKPEDLSTALDDALATSFRFRDQNR
jgi:hypothetical protein